MTGTAGASSPNLDLSGRKFLTVQDMARMVGVSTTTIYNAAKKGRLALHDFEGRTVAKAEDFEAFATTQLKAWTPKTKPRKASAARAARSRASWER
jgi:excisionase family DNA binding protein